MTDSADLRSVEANPNADTVAAMMEAECISQDLSVKGYTDVNELFEELNKE